MLNKIQAQHLPKIDALGSVDPYVVLHLGPDEYKTNTIKKNYHSEWDETFTLIVKDDTQVWACVRVYRLSWCERSVLLVRTLFCDSIQSPRKAERSPATGLQRHVFKSLQSDCYDIGRKKSGQDFVVSIYDWDRKSKDDVIG